MEQIIRECVINGCTREGKTRIIYSPDQHYGWICEAHYGELHGNNYPDLEGSGYDLKMGEMKNCQVGCGNCHYCAPCNVCHYVRTEDNTMFTFEELGIPMI